MSDPLHVSEQLQVILKAVEENAEATKAAIQLAHLASGGVSAPATPPSQPSTQVEEKSTPLPTQPAEPKPAELSPQKAEEPKAPEPVSQPIQSPPSQTPTPANEENKVPTFAPKETTIDDLADKVVAPLPPLE